MRVDAFKEKKLEHVVIPPKLLEFLKEVFEKIQAGDEGAMLESDDLLQNREHLEDKAGAVYGGLMDDGDYGFTYFPEDGTRYTWELYLSVEQIKAISEGKTTSLDLWACQHNGCKSKWQAESESCFYCDYEEVDDRAN